MQSQSVLGQQRGAQQKVGAGEDIGELVWVSTKWGIRKVTAWALLLGVRGRDGYKRGCEQPT